MSLPQSSIISEIEAKAIREQEIHAVCKEFLRGVITNLCLPEGVSGMMDIAFKIDRREIINKVLQELIDEQRE